MDSDTQPKEKADEKWNKKREVVFDVFDLSNIFGVFKIMVQKTAEWTY